MATFSELLNQYQNTQLAATDRRKSASGFLRLAEKGSIGAAFTFGLLSAESDEADKEKGALERLVTAAQLELAGRKQESDEMTANALADLRDAQARGARAKASTEEQTGVASAEAGIEKDKALAKGTNVQTGILEETGVDAARAKIYRDTAAGTSAIMTAETGQSRAETDKTYKEGSLSLQEQQLNLDTKYKAGRLGIDEYNAQTQRLRAESDESYKQGTLGLQGQQLALDREYKAGRISVDRYNAESQRINAQTQGFRARTDQSYKQGTLSLQGQQLALDRDYKAGRISVDQYNAESQRINAMSSSTYRGAQTEAVKEETKYIPAKTQAGIDYTKAQTGGATATTAGKVIDNRTREELNLAALQAQKADTQSKVIQTSTIIPKTAEQLAASRQSREVQKFTLRQNAIQRQIDNKIKQGSFKNENERNYYALQNERYSHLRTRETIQEAIKKLEKKPEAGWFDFVGDFSESIFGKSKEKLKAEDVKIKELGFLKDRLELFKGF